MNPAIDSFKRTLRMLQTAQNPQSALMQFAQKNPQMAQIMQICNGKNPKDVFYSECQRMGVNPEEIISQLGM